MDIVTTDCASDEDERKKKKGVEVSRGIGDL